MSGRREIHTSSRTWVAPRVKDNSNRQALNHARRKVCPNSPFWTLNFELEKHKESWEAGRRRRLEQKMIRDMEIAETRQKIQGTRFPIPPTLRPAFDGKVFDTSRGTVLSHETVFCPQWENEKDTMAPWPSKPEQKYEGDDRISTDRLHRRFPGAPRVEGNETVNWQHRAVVEQFHFDDFYYPIPHAVDIFLRTHWVADLEFSDQEGEEVLGKEMMGMLDPKDQW